MHILDKGSSFIVESIIRAFESMDALTSEEPLLLVLIDDHLKRQASEIPSVGALRDRGRIITPGEPSSCLPIIFQHAFLPEYQYLACVFMNNYLLLPCYPLG